jgi:hypothetical protein
MESFAFGAREVERLGRVLGFRVKMFTMVNMGTKYFGGLPYFGALPCF